MATGVVVARFYTSLLVSCALDKATQDLVICEEVDVLLTTLLLQTESDAVQTEDSQLVHLLSRVLQQELDELFR